MAASVAQMRTDLKRIYGTQIRGKKIDSMTDSQVVAIHMRLKLQGKI